MAPLQSWFGLFLLAFNGPMAILQRPQRRLRSQRSHQSCAGAFGLSAGMRQSRPNGFFERVLDPTHWLSALPDVVVE